VKARRVVAKILREDGYSFPEIADALEREQTAAIHMLKKDPPEEYVTAVRKLILCGESR